MCLRRSKENFPSFEKNNETKIDLKRVLPLLGYEGIQNIFFILS